MNSKTWTRIIALTLFAALALPLQLPAQNTAKPHHPHRYHHYQVVDPGTFGGPGNGLQAPFFPRTGVLNNQGTLVGAADGAAVDPFCGNPPNCLIFNAFQWQNGVTTDLGVLPGGFTSQSQWISENGLIVGLGDNGQWDPVAGFPLPQLHGILWEHGGMTDLGTLPEGGYLSFPLGVNNRGEVVGFAQNTVPDPNSMGFPGYGTQTRAFYWKNGAMQDLGTLGTGTDAAAALVNERGQVVGWSYTNATPSAICAGAGFGQYGFVLTTSSFLWDAKNGMRDIGGLGGSCTIATDLNNRGQIVGLSALPGDLVMHPFVWDAATGMTDLLGASSGLTNPFFALTINEHGVVAGSAIDQAFNFYPFVWRQIGKKWKQTDLGVNSVPTSINASAQVVGYGSISFLWEDGGPAIDLSTLVPPNITLGEVNQINNRGEIAAQGTDPNGNHSAFLLIPCDENHPGVEGCDYSMVDATATAKTAPVQAAQPSFAGTGNIRMPIGLRDLLRGPMFGRQNRFGSSAQK
jgi:hypothetical protein